MYAARSNDMMCVKGVYLKQPGEFRVPVGDVGGAFLGVPQR